MSRNQPRESIDVETVMERIRDKARQEFHESYSRTDMQDDLQFVMDNCQARQERIISSHRRWFGWLFVWFRKMLYGEICRSIDPALKRQADWNRKAAYILHKQQAEIERLRRLVRKDSRPRPDSETPDEADASGPDPLA
jgi:hypothetical protein